MSETIIDLLLINPGGRNEVYQGLGERLTAVEPPLWCRLLAGYARDRNFNVSILDSEAENIEVTENISAVGKVVSLFRDM